LLRYESRLKKVQGKKKRDNAAKMEERAVQDKSPVMEASIQEGEEGAANLLSTKDEDIIF
jgi:V-type H+-transporting ATPase subunit D